ncbi:MAG: TetR/AcrR family transcriptional regulator [Clostridiales bacterium]|nr:TetR/AcrR family transcriptional regulator [Clostridiales bacterium]
MGDNYHHGNLRQALIDAGIKIINESGEDGLSLRKVAAFCNVSHAAPYAHFRDKEELIEAIKKNVTDRFMEELERSVKGASGTDEELVNMGRRYVTFFVKNPDYFKFLFSSQKITAHLYSDNKDDYPPFLFLKKEYAKYLSENNIERTDEEREIDLIRLWSSVHGLAAIACMSGVEVSFDWEDKILGDILIK